MAFSFGKPPATNGASNSLFGSSSGTGNALGAPQGGPQQQSGVLGAHQNSGAPFGARAPSQQGGLFGGGGATQQASAGAAQQSASGASQVQTGGLFSQQGQGQGQQTGLFGQQGQGQGQSTGLFGQQGQGQGQSTGLFGQQGQGQGQSTGLFGQQGQGQNQSTGLFGQQGQGQGQQTGLFGQQPSLQTPAQPTNLFGASQPAGSTLGQSQLPQQGGFFGATQTPQNPAQKTSLFGETQSTSGTQSTFNTQNAQGASSSSLFGASALQPTLGTTAPQFAQPDKKLGMPMNAQLDRICASWNTTNLATCLFQCYLYNRANDAQNAEQLTVRRHDATGSLHDALWVRAVQENPEPSRLYPVLAVGFGDLQTRVNAQTAEAARQRSKVAELFKQLVALQQKHDLSNLVRAQSASRMQMCIHQRLLGLLKDSHLLIPALRGQSLAAAEENMSFVLQNCEAQLQGGNTEYTGAASQVSLRARVNELWAQLGIVRAKREALLSNGLVESGVTEWAVVDEANFEEIEHILASLQQGLSHLTGTLNADTKALDMICDGLAGVSLVGVRNR